MSTAISDAVNEIAPAEPYTPTEEAAKLLDYARRQIEYGEQMRRGFNESAWTNLAFYMGRQWAQFDSRTGRMYEPDVAAGERRRVLNYIKPAVLSTIAKLTQHQPGWIVMPGTSDEDDIQAARACDKLLEHIWYDVRMRTKLPRGILAAVITGVGIFRAGWDMDAGDEYDDPGTDADQEHEAAPKARKKTGAPTLSVCSIFNTYIDPGATEPDMSDARWVAEVCYLPIDEVRACWENGKYVSPDSCVVVDNFSEELYRDLRSDAGDAPTPDDGSLSDRVRVIFYYEKASPQRYKDGLYAVMTDTVMLEVSNELPFNELPYAIVRFDQTPGKLLGLGMVAGAVSPQEVINEQTTQRLNTLALMAAPKWVAEEGSIGKNVIDSTAGEVIMVRKGAGFTPHTVPPPPMTPEHANMTAECIDHIRQITGANEITQGIASAGTSGRAAQWMAELDASKLSLVSQEIEDACARLGYLFLRYWHAYTQVARTVKVVGESRRVEVLEFQTSDIRSYDVRVLQGSMRVRHPSTRREEVMLAWQNGGYGDRNDPRAIAQFRRDMEMGDLDYVQGNTDAEAVYAREENYVYGKLSEESEPRPWEDHDTHIREHKALLMSVAFRNLPRETQNALVTHIAKHEKLKAEAAQGVPWWATQLGIQPQPPAQQPAQPPAQQPQPAPQRVQVRGPGIGASDIVDDSQRQ